MKQLILLMLVIVSLHAAAQLPKVASGTLVRWENIGNKDIAPRNVDIWLPEGYTASRKYAVLYMHDGQMLFDSTTTWNKQEWMVDEIIGGLLRNKTIRPVIVVGIWNNGAYRHQEYFPEKPLGYLDTSMRNSIINNELKGRAMADEYLQFLVKTLKPKIDSAFSTQRDAGGTFIAGSSMGGLISMYAYCEYPEVFGGAACLSTHWPGSLRLKDPAIPKAFDTYIDQHIPAPGKRRIYFDLGDQTLDSLYAPWQIMVDVTLAAKGYTSAQWITRVFPGAAHTEQAWQQRLHEPVIFLLGKKQKGKKVK
jgi:enterochelin esterase-like enzyme